MALRHTVSCYYFSIKGKSLCFSPCSLSAVIQNPNIILQASEILIPHVMCCEIMLLYPVKICHLYWFNQMLIDQYPSRKNRWSVQTKRILGRGKAETIIFQRKQDENYALRKDTKSSS